MMCKYFRVRTQKYIKYYYCTAKKQKISFCNCCRCELCCNKQYKPLNKKPIIKKANKVSKMAKATDISMDVKYKVWERDSHCCIFCGKLVPVSNANAHFIPRSAGGLGIEENIFTACNQCHHEQDNGLNTAEYDLRAEKYLKNFYGLRWNKENLIYKKY